MSATVALIPHCVECGKVTADGRGALGAYLTGGEPPELAFYCPECAERELK